MWLADFYERHRRSGQRLGSQRPAPGDWSGADARDWARQQTVDYWRSERTHADSMALQWVVTTVVGASLCFNGWLTFMIRAIDEDSWRSTAASCILLACGIALVAFGATAITQWMRASREADDAIHERERR